ncbi:dihydrodipicolinate synthase family protein [Polluticaenibacter yanchengensis]|uniref:Dihydrodipicolinate synthase family protein n=1 Tax=Polluticaenibacter yanchengensis TaxID=3014562 RepID=A0ABT4UPA6_9BACT|nr:dihydrodipicolinate synthase family protein [Chitinophagaceae bacterium LY-5]
MSESKGFVPVMLTPFHKDGSIDFNGLTSLTEFYIKAGAKGLFANCQSSEMFDLSKEERLQIIAHVLKVTAGRMPVVAAGNFGNTIAEQAVFVKEVYGLGVQAVILLTNQLAAEKEDDRIFEKRIFELLSLTENIPVGFYECPVPYKRLISPELLGKIVKTGRAIYHKDTCLDIDQIKEKLANTALNKSFGLYDAYMVHAVDSLKAGSAGLSCIQGNYFPELIVWICDHYNNPALAHSVNAVQQFLITEMAVMHDYYPKSAKYFLSLRGMEIAAYTRKSGNEVVDAQVKGLMEALYKRYCLLVSENKLVLNDIQLVSS